MLTETMISFEIASITIALKVNYADDNMVPVSVEVERIGPGICHPFSKNYMVRALRNILEAARPTTHYHEVAEAVYYLRTQIKLGGYHADDIDALKAEKLLTRSEWANANAMHYSKVLTNEGLYPAWVAHVEADKVGGN